MSRGYIAGLVGPEGSGKTLGMTHFMMKRRKDACPLYTFPGYRVQDGRKDRPTFGEPWSEDIDPAQALLIQNLPPRACIGISELPQFFDSMLFSTTTSRLFGQVGTQRRKLDLTIIYDAQNWLHVHPRIRWATHYLIVCKDQYYDPEQRADGRTRGQFINMTIWDVKGFSTGREWTCMGMVTLFAHHYWDYYDTFAVVDPSEGMMQFTTKKRRLVLDATQQGGPRIYKPGEALLNENGERIEDAPAPPVDLTGDPSRDADLLSRVAATGQLTVKELAEMARGLARGRR